MLCRLLNSYGRFEELYYLPLQDQIAQAHSSWAAEHCSWRHNSVSKPR